MQNHRKVMAALYSLGLIALIGGCAQAPESIAPAPVSDAAYRSWSCDRLAGEQQNLASAYAVAAQQQSRVRSNDTVGVILLGLPVSSLAGDDIAPKVARLKGEREAVARALAQKNCTSAEDTANPQRR